MDPGRPAFARDFPRDPALDALVDAFAEGDYRRVRSEGAILAGSAASVEVQRAARTLVDRTRPDPLSVWLLALSAVLLVVVSTYWIVNGKAPPDASSPQRLPVEHVGRPANP
jgi:hypothetical protein